MDIAEQERQIAEQRKYLLENINRIANNTGIDKKVLLKIADCAQGIGQAEQIVKNYNNAQIMYKKLQNKLGNIK